MFVDGGAEGKESGRINSKTKLIFLVLYVYVLLLRVIMGSRNGAPTPPPPPPSDVLIPLKDIQLQNREPSLPGHQTDSIH